jgi:hypothetical protein
MGIDILDPEHARNGQFGRADGHRLGSLIEHGNRTLISEWSNDCSRRLGGYPTFG